MTYIEVRKDGKLVKRRLVEDTRAEKGCRIRVGSAGQVHLRKGELKTIGPYEIEMLEGVPPEDGYKAPRQLGTKSDSLPPMSGTEQAEFIDMDQTRSMEMKSSFPTIDDYEVIGRLGQGGMGTVWRAVQLSTKREVALKFLGKHRFASKRSRARFEREVSLAAKLTHPNIACVYDSGLHRGVYYYAMELVDGIHLDKYVRQNQLTQQEILTLMKDVCDAVGYAHDKGIIHRDLKPSNILVTKDGRPHVVDFGLAKASIDEDELTISVDGEITGTLAYMSPEQAAGRLDKIGEPTDVYSLGVILHQLLTGHFPHDVSGSRYDVVKRIVEEDVQSPRTYDDSVDSDLESLILTALAQEPENRYPSAVILSQDIENYLNKEPLLARSMSATYRIRKHVRKHAKPIAKSFLFIVIVVASIAITYSLVRPKIPALGPSEQDMAEEVSDLENQQQRPSVGTNYVINKEEVMKAVHRYQDGLKRANLFGGDDLEEVISDKAFAMAGPDQGNPSVAGVWDKEAAIKLAMSMPDDPTVGYGVNFIDIFGPMAYVGGKCTRFTEDGTRHRVETVYFLAKDETGWKFISAGEASYIRKSLRIESSSTQGQVENENDRAAIQTLMDRINNSWINKTGSIVMQETVSNKAFAFALPSLDNPSEAVVVNKQAFCELYGKMQQDRELQKQEHLIKAISVFGPLAFEVGDTCNTYRDGRKEYHRSLNFFAKDETGWKMYFSTSADSVNQALNKELSDEEKISKLAQEYVNGFRLDEPIIPVERINRICSEDFVVIMSDGEKIVGKENYIKRFSQIKRLSQIKQFSQGIEPLQSEFSDLHLKLTVNSVSISGSVGKIVGKISWAGEGAESLDLVISVSLTFNKTNGIWLLVREEQKKSEPDTSEVSGVIQDTKYQSWMPRRASAPAAIQIKGEPFFLICVKGAKPEDFSEYKQAGFNAVLLYDSNSIGFSEAEKHGLHVISQLTFNKANPPDLDQIKQRLAQDAKQSSLLSWMSASLWPVHSWYYENFEHIVREAIAVSPKTPIFLSIYPRSTKNLSGTMNRFGYSNGFVLDPHIFDKSEAKTGYPTEVSTISFWMDQMEGVMKSRPIWAIVKRYGPKKMDMSMIEEKNDRYRSLVYLAVNHGATGIIIPAYDEDLHFMYKDKMVKSELAGGLRTLSIPILAGAILDEVTITNDHGKIDFNAYMGGYSRFFVVAVNTSETEVTPTIHIPEFSQGSIYRENEHGGGINENEYKKNWQFVDTFKPYQTHVYTIRTREDLGK